MTREKMFSTNLMIDCIIAKSLHQDISAPFQLKQRHIMLHTPNTFETQYHTSSVPSNHHPLLRPLASPPFSFLLTFLPSYFLLLSSCHFSG